MKSTKHFVILLILLLLSTGLAQSAKTPSPKGQAVAEISNTRSASCVVKITSDRMVLPLDNVTIDYLLHSTSIGGKVAREVLDISSDEASDIFKIEALVGSSGKIVPESLDKRGPGSEVQSEYERIIESRFPSVQLRPSLRPGSTTRTNTATSPSPTAEQTIVFQLSVKLGNDIKPAAKEFMDALIGNLRSSLTKAFEDYKARFKDQHQLADAEATRAEEDLREKQKTLREIAGSRDLDRTQILADIRRLRQEVQAAKMNLASSQVIIEATSKRISEIQAKVQERLENDSITMELRAIVEMSDKLLVLAEQAVEAGKMPADKLEETKKNLALARIELAKRRESLTKSAGGNLIESLNKELSDRTIGATQDGQRILDLEKELVEADSLLVKTDDYELLALKTDIAKQNLQESMLWCDRMSRQIRLLQPPMVSILGGE